MIEHNISILIPSWNGEKYIESCLNSLLKNEYRKFKIISIAGGTDKAFEISLEYQKKYPNKMIALHRKEGKKNEALNIGLKDVDGDIIIMTDVDCIYHKDWLKRINEIFQNNKINLITSFGIPYLENESSFAEYNKIRVGYGLLKFENGQIVIGNKLWGGCSAFRKDVFFKKIGKFEEISITGDDKILGIEFNRQGEDLYYFWDIYVITEHYSDNMKKYIKHRIRWAKDLFIDFKKKKTFKLLFLLGIGLFKLFYPLIIMIFWLIFFNFSLFWLFVLLSPWITFYLCWDISVFFELKKKAKIVNSVLNMNLNYKKAFKIVPLMFFVYGIINFVSFINPKKRKW